MIVTIVRFPGSSSESVDALRELIAHSAHGYLTVPGLRWKSYVRADDGSVGGIYWWDDRASAEAKFNPGWLAGVTAKYGTAPTVEYLESPLVVDAENQVLRTN